MATRFDLADGRNTWSRPVDPTTDSGSGDEGTIIGADGGRVYAYAADDRNGADGALLTRYTVHALAADTGEVLWRTATGDGGSATVPDRDQGSATTVPEGVVTAYGDQGRQYALLDGESGQVRWKRPLPDSPYDCLLRSAAERAYLVCATDMEKSTARSNVSLLDMATGKPRWTVQVGGAVDVLGEDRGRLVLGDAYHPGDRLTLINVSSHVLTVVRLADPQPDGANAYMTGGTLYFTRSSGSVRAVSPRTGRTLWETNSTVEQQGPPTASATHVYLASPSGRLAALNARTGKVEATRPGRDDGGPAGSGFVTTGGAPLVLDGDALYVPYGVRSVFAVDVNNLADL
ncbi:PQQ-binding-like beta-propeller repeat protein [Streptomyces sp. S.PNR 29]|nr:PQQ-binding-like beta-propeller repeat protein [Streptomyces sp. S.PNR 29]